MRRLEERSRPVDGNRLGIGSSFEERSRLKENKRFAQWGTWPEMFLVD